MKDSGPSQLPNAPVKTESLATSEPDTQNNGGKRGDNQLPCAPVKTENLASSGTEARSNDGARSDITKLEGRIRAAEKWMIWLTAAIAFFALCSVVVGVLQWAAISGGSSDTHDLAVAAKAQADKMASMADAADKIRQAAQDMVREDQRIADNARDSLNASSRQSQKALDASISATRLEQRAWVAAVAVELDTIDADKPVSGYVAWSNSGRSFAKEVKPLCHYISIPSSISNEPQLMGLVAPSTQIGSIGVLPPQARYKTIIKGEQPIPALQKDTMATYSWYTYVWGEITYKDVFGNLHATTFCDSRQGISGDFIQCPFHNDAN